MSRTLYINESNYRSLKNLENNSYIRIIKIENISNIENPTIRLNNLENLNDIRIVNAENLTLILDKKIYNLRYLFIKDSIVNIKDEYNHLRRLDKYVLKIDYKYFILYENLNYVTNLTLKNKNTNKKEDLILENFINLKEIIFENINSINITLTDLNNLEEFYIFSGNRVSIKLNSGLNSLQNIFIYDNFVEVIDNDNNIQKLGKYFLRINQNEFIFDESFNLFTYMEITAKNIEFNMSECNNLNSLMLNNFDTLKLNSNFLALNSLTIDSNENFNYEDIKNFIINADISNSKFPILKDLIISTLNFHIHNDIFPELENLEISNYKNIKIESNFPKLKRLIANDIIDETTFEEMDFENTNSIINLKGSKFPSLETLDIQDYSLVEFKCDYKFSTIINLFFETEKLNELLLYFDIEQKEIKNLVISQRNLKISQNLYNKLTIENKNNINYDNVIMPLRKSARK